MKSRTKRAIKIFDIGPEAYRIISSASERMILFFNLRHTPNGWTTMQSGFKPIKTAAVRWHDSCIIMMVYDIIRRCRWLLK